MMQRVLDNPFLLLFLGVTLPAVLYVIWGRHGNRQHSHSQVTERGRDGNCTS